MTAAVSDAIFFTPSFDRSPAAQGMQTGEFPPSSAGIVHIRDHSGLGQMRIVLARPKALGHPAATCSSQSA